MVFSYPLDVDGVPVRIIEAGSGPKHVLFLHGLGARADRWRMNLDVAADAGYHAVAFDLPGHGFSLKGPGFDYSVRGFAALAAAVMRRLEMPSAALVGTSLGGHIVSRLAVDQPSAARGLMLIGVTGIVPLGVEVRNSIREAVRKTAKEAVVAKFNFVLEQKRLITAELIEEEWRINNSPGAAQSLAMLGDYFAAHLDEDVVGEQLKALVGRIPMSLVWGDKDKAVPLAVGEKSSEVLGEKVPLQIIGDTGHAPYLERPDAFNPMLLAFLRDCFAEARPA